MKSFLFLTLSILPISAFAHVRWFIDSDTIPNVPFNMNANTGFGLLFILLFVSSIFLLENLGQKNGTLLFFMLRKDWGFCENIHWYILIGLLNIVLINNLMLGEYLAPNLLLDPSVIVIGIIIQSAVLVLIPFSVTLVGVALSLVAFLNFIFFTPDIALDYFFEFLGVGAAFVFIGQKLCRFDHRFLSFIIPRHWNNETAAVLSLRIGLGLQLLELAIHNKFIDTGYALIFVETYSHYNFMQLLGWNSFSHTDFVFFAGFFEATFGLLLITGYSPRVVSITLGIIFTTTAIVSGIEELVGHLPILGVLLILIIKEKSGGSHIPLILDKRITNSR